MDNNIGKRKRGRPPKSSNSGRGKENDVPPTMNQQSSMGKDHCHDLLSFQKGVEYSTSIQYPLDRYMAAKIARMKRLQIIREKKLRRRILNQGIENMPPFHQSSQSRKPLSILSNPSQRGSSSNSHSRKPLSILSNSYERGSSSGSNAGKNSRSQPFKPIHTGQSAVGSDFLNPTSSRTQGKSVKKNNVFFQPGLARNLNVDFESVSGIHYEDPNVYPNSNVEFHSESYSLGEQQDVFDLGDATFTCNYCGAIMWYQERSLKYEDSEEPDFSICCMKGNVQLPLLIRPPELLYNLINHIDPRSDNFKDNIRVYNSLFSFTSIGGKVENSVNDGNGPPNFILSGQNYHRIGSLLPSDGTPPKFAQLYIYDTNNETSNRLRHFRNNKNGCLDSSLVEDLTRMVDTHNVLAQSFRMVRDFVASNETQNFSLRLFRSRQKDARVYNLPSTDEVAALIVGDLHNMEVGRDIVVKKCTGELSRLHETHTAFIPLQYPLLFPYGEDGFQEKIPLRSSVMESNSRKRKRVSLRMFISFRLQERHSEYGNIVTAGRLFQQFCVDSYTMIENQKLSYLRHNQTKIRSDLLSGLQEAVERGDIEPSSAGMRVVLPASFTGGPRYMFNNCQDVMAICKRFGYPDLFITMTCNTNWSEIKNFVGSRGQRPDERLDILCRVFKMKLDQVMVDLRKTNIFGKTDAVMYTIEFQKRGLPHAHILLWLSGNSKLYTTDDIDRIISAEIPDPNLYPELSAAVSNFMIHGPCGTLNKNSPCMKDGQCSKLFPKKFQQRTVIDEEGYPRYRRRDSGITIRKKEIEVDNRNVVPYNPFLLMRYQAHINVEYCNKSNNIKYLFKYVNKGPDRVSVEISGSHDQNHRNHVVDEIKQYYDCRYLSPCEALWKTFSFHIHQRWPSVKKLTFHLPKSQNIVFRDNQRIDDVVARTQYEPTMFTAWFTANRLFSEGHDLIYSEFPLRFVYDQDLKEWRVRQKGFQIGRLNYIPPASGELYYLRILLTVQKGCTSFESLRTVNGIVYKTYEDACFVLGLLKDDKEYIDAISEASDLAFGHQLRRLFVTLPLMNTMSKADVVFENTWKILSDGILFDRRNRFHLPDLHISDEDLKNLCLIEIEKLLQMNGRSLRDFGSMPYPEFSEATDFENQFIVDELNYDREELMRKHKMLLSSMTDEQRDVYNTIMNDVVSSSGGFFFLYGYGGTGKTFVWNTLSATIRSRGQIVLNVASSGIASLLLPGGRTAHSRFCIPIGIHELSTCAIKQGSPRAKLLQQAQSIIRDEVPMLNRFCFEALDRTLRDIMSIESLDNAEKPFGGKVVVLGGDFRQILPVIQKGSRHDIVSASINSSDIWKYCQVLKLTKNMRLTTTVVSQDSKNLRDFAEWILKIGDGHGENLCNQNGEYDLDIPDDLLILDDNDSLLQLVNFTYPGLTSNENLNVRFFEERAILTPTLESVEIVNDFILSTLPGPEIEYLSSDSACSSDEDSEIRGEWFTTEFLNDIKCSGIPGHKLKLKVGVPIMLLRNIYQASGLCNGTRLIVNELGKNVIGATVITGTNVGDKIFIPRMNLIPSDPGFPFKFVRRQFPISLCFAMTINKSQGQTLSTVGLFLRNPVFTHGQLYVAVSRVRSREGLKILILDEAGKASGSTKNVVYKEVFNNL